MEPNPRNATRVRSDISVLAGDVLAQLGSNRADLFRSRHAAQTEALIAAILGQLNFDAHRMITDLQHMQLSDEIILGKCIPAAAEALGTGWVTDTMSFAAVTVGSARLQTMVTMLAPPFTGPGGSGPGARRAALFVLPGRDTHTLGAHVAAAQLRRLGTSIRFLFGGTPDNVVEAVARTPYDLLLFGCPANVQLDLVREIMSSLRAASGTPPPSVLGGMVLDRVDDAKRISGVDHVTNDVRTALGLCEARKASERVWPRQ